MDSNNSNIAEIIEGIKDKACRLADEFRRNNPCWNAAEGFYNRGKACVRVAEFNSARFGDDANTLWRAAQEFARAKGGKVFIARNEGFYDTTVVIEFD